MQLAFSYQMPSDFRKSSFASKRQSTGCIVAHGIGQPARARTPAPIIREIWAAGYMSYDAVSRELNRRQVPTLRAGKQWYPMAAGQLLVRSGTDRAHSYSASTCLLAARVFFAGEQEHSEAMRPIARCYRGCVAGRHGFLNITMPMLGRGGLAGVLTPSKIAWRPRLFKQVVVSSIMIA